VYKSRSRLEHKERKSKHCSQSSTWFINLDFPNPTSWFRKHPNNQKSPFGMNVEMNNPLSITPALNAIKHIQKDKTFDLPYTEYRTQCTSYCIYIPRLSKSCAHILTNVHDLWQNQWQISYPVRLLNKKIMNSLTKILAELFCFTYTWSTSHKLKLETIMYTIVRNWKNNSDKSFPERIMCITKGIWYAELVSIILLQSRTTLLQWLVHDCHLTHLSTRL